MSKKKIIDKTFIAVITTIFSGFFLISCNAKNPYLDFLQEDYIKQNFEDDIISDLSKNNENIKKEFGNLENFNFDEKCIKNQKKEKICEYIYADLYENFTNKHFQHNYLFNEKKFIAEKLLAKNLVNSTIDINNLEEKIIPVVKNNNFENLFQNIGINYEYYQFYFNKETIPKIYNDLLIIEYLKNNKKYVFDTELQSYKINLISIPKKNNENSNSRLLSLLEQFSIKYKNNEKNFDIYELNDLMAGLNSKTAKKYHLKHLNKNYTLITNQHGQEEKEKIKIPVYELTLISELYDTIENQKYKKQNIPLKEYQILEERKIRLKNFIKSDWYTKENLDFNEDINNILKKNLFNHQINNLLKNKNTFNTTVSDNNIKCFPKSKKCFYVHEANKNDDNIVFMLKDNFYIVEIEDYFSSDSKNTEMYKILKKTINKNYEKYKKEALEYFLKNKEINFNIKGSKKICEYFQQQYKNLTFQCQNN